MDIRPPKISDIDLEKIFGRALKRTLSVVGFEARRSGIVAVLLWIGTIWLWRTVSPLPELPEELSWGVATVASASIVFVGVLFFSLVAAPYRIERDRRRKLQEKFRTLHRIAGELREALRARLIDLDDDLHVEAESASVRLQALEIDGDEEPASKRWMFLLERVRLMNRSEQSRLSLDVYLSVPRAGDSGREDDLVLRERAGAGLYYDSDTVEWLESPVELEPGETAAGHLGFWVPIWAFDDPEELKQVDTDAAVLRFHDHVSGQTVDRRLHGCVPATGKAGTRRRA
jgi:hypothetical protein